MVFAEAGRGVVGWCMRIAVRYRECHCDLTDDVVSMEGFLFFFPFILAALRVVDRIHMQTETLSYISALSSRRGPIFLNFHSSA